MIPIPIPVGHGLESDCLLDELLHAALDFNRVVAEMLIVHVAYDEHALDRVRTGDGLDLVMLVGLDLGLNVEIALGKVPAHVVEWVALDGAGHLGVGVYVRHLVHHVRVACDRGWKVDRERDERLGDLTNAVDWRHVLRIAAISSFNLNQTFNLNFRLKQIDSLLYLDLRGPHS